MALLRTQLIIAPMIPGSASAALIPNFPCSDAKALSLDLFHSFKLASSLGGDSPPDATVPPPPPPGINASTSTPIDISIAVSMEVIVMPCSLNSVWIFSPDEVLLSNTLAIVSQKLVIWLFSLPLRISIDSSCLTFSSSFRVSIHLVMSSLMPSSYSPRYFQILSSLCCSF